MPRPARPRTAAGKQTPLFFWPTWCARLEHVRNQGPTWLYVALAMTHLLCCRITEVMRLTAESFDHEKKCVTIEALKRQATTTKPFSEATYMVTESMRTYGVSVQRARRNGARGHEVHLDKWTWPETGLLFPATRKDSSLSDHSKDVVAAAIRKVRSTFARLKAPAPSASRTL